MRVANATGIAALMAALCLSPSSSPGQSVEDSAEAAGILGACWSQALTIDSYDVCIDAWQSGLKPDGTDFEIRSIYLLTRDIPEQKYRFLRHEEKREGDARSTCVSAITMDQDVGSWLTCDGRFELDSNHALERILPRNDVRLAGHTIFPWTEIRPELGKSITDKYTPARRFVLRQKNREAVITQEELTNKQRFTTYWKVDLESSLPVEYRRSWHVESADRWRTLLREEITWDQSPLCQCEY